MKVKTKIEILILFIGFLFFLEVGPTLAIDPLELQVPIPGGDKSINFDGTTKPIGQYIQSIYTYAISIVGIAATIMLMVGGLTWLTAGGSGEKVGKARDIIFSSLTGLVLALTSYTILMMINPNLVNFKIQNIDPPAVINAPKINPLDPATKNIFGCCLTGNVAWTGCIESNKYDCSLLKQNGTIPNTEFKQEASCKENYKSGNTQVWKCEGKRHIAPVHVGPNNNNAGTENECTQDEITNGDCVW